MQANATKNNSLILKKEVVMLLILEIMLTITAWRSGYKALALMPLGFAFLLGFLIASNNPDSGDILSYVWIDILAIIVLVVMIAIAKKPEEEVEKSMEVREVPENAEYAGLNTDAQSNKELVTIDSKSEGK